MDKARDTTLLYSNRQCCTLLNVDKNGIYVGSYLINMNRFTTEQSSCPTNSSFAQPYDLTFEP